MYTYLEKMIMSWYSEGKYSSQTQYDWYATIQVKLKFNTHTDKDIIDWVRKQKKDPNSSIQGSIKRLIREEISRTSDDSNV